MKREFYKMYHKKYFFALCFLLLLPFLFGIGTFFHLPYMIDGDISASALDYCAEMQELVKFFFFLIVVYLAGDFFAGEREDGQLCMGILRICNRKNMICFKIMAYAVLIFLFQLVFWLFNIAVYSACSMKDMGTVIVQSYFFKTYLEIFFGYWEMALLFAAIAILAGLYLKKIYTIILVYFVWLGLRYVNELISLKQVFPEFYADFLLENGNTYGVGIYEMSFIVGGVLFIAIMFQVLYLFGHRDIT